MQTQRGLGELRLLDFLTSALYGRRLSASRTGRLYPRDIPGTHLNEGLSRPQGYGLVGRKYVTEKSSDTIDPGTVRLVAQRLNHCATPGPY
jgi:hypothetical protein